MTSSFSPETSQPSIDIDYRKLGDRVIVCAAGGAGIVGETFGGTVPALLGALAGAALAIKFEFSRQQG